MIFKKIQKFTKKVFSSKTYVLIGINRVMPNNLGEIIDLEIDRDEKEIYIQMKEGEKKANINILGYALKYEGLNGYLTFINIEKTGYLKSRLKDAQISKKIKIEAKYIKLVERLV